MEDYLALIDRLDTEDSAELINNSSTQHAIYLIARLFARARSNIRVFSGSLNKDIYAQPPVLDALRVFLIGRGGRLEVLVQNASQEDVVVADGVVARLRNELGPEALGRVEVRLASEATKAHAKSHFLVIDDKGFRFEPDNTSHKAVASFNSPPVASQLKGMFEGLFSTGKKISLA